jgi:hypothetical protein
MNQLKVVDNNLRNQAKVIKNSPVYLGSQFNHKTGELKVAQYVWYRGDELRDDGILETEKQILWPMRPFYSMVYLLFWLVTPPANRYYK